MTFEIIIFIEASVTFQTNLIMIVTMKGADCASQSGVFRPAKGNRGKCV